MRGAWGRTARLGGGCKDVEENDDPCTLGLARATDNGRGRDPEDEAMAEGTSEEVRLLA